MLDLPKLSKVPKWALYTSAGVVIAGGAIYVFRNRDAPPADDTLDTSEPGTSSGYDSTWSSGIPATTIVPPIYNQPDNSNLLQGTADLSELYMGGISELLGVFKSQIDSSQNTIYASIRQGADIYGEGVQVGLGALGGGGAPQSYGPAGGGTPGAPPAAAPAPPACPGNFPYRRSDGACYRIDYDNRTRNSGKNYWCNRVTIHRYPNGEAHVIAEDKIRNGAC